MTKGLQIFLRHKFNLRDLACKFAKGRVGRIRPHHCKLREMALEFRSWINSNSVSFSHHILGSYRFDLGIEDTAKDSFTKSKFDNYFNHFL